MSYHMLRGLGDEPGTNPPIINPGATSLGCGPNTMAIQGSCYCVPGTEVADVQHPELGCKTVQPAVAPTVPALPPPWVQPGQVNPSTPPEVWPTPGPMPTTQPWAMTPDKWVVLGLSGLALYAIWKWAENKSSVRDSFSYGDAYRSLELSPVRDREAINVIRDRDALDAYHREAMDRFQDRATDMSQRQRMAAFAKAHRDSQTAAREASRQRMVPISDYQVALHRRA